MAHKVMVDGTAYSVTGGTTLVDGTSYSVTSGKTMVDSTVYEISFGAAGLDPTLAAALVDFEYTVNSDGTVTITDWLGTTNGASGTEIIIPDDSRIIL